MKVRLECVSGGICYHKEIEVDGLPYKGEVMTFAIVEGSGRNKELFVVDAVKEAVIVLRAPERISFELSSLDGWARYPVSGFNWPA